MVAEMVKNARAILCAKGLPDAPKLWWRKGSDNWQGTPLSFEECGKASNLDHYILKTLGLPHDSPEGIAAQIIMGAHRLETWEGGARDKQAFLLGQLAALYKVYGLESATNTKNSKENRRHRWAELLAAKLVENNPPTAKFPALWEKIPEDENERYDGFEVYRKDKSLCASSGTKNEEITKETFRTEYIAKSRKKATQQNLKK